MAQRDAHSEAELASALLASAPGDEVLFMGGVLASPLPTGLRFPEANVTITAMLDARLGGWDITPKCEGITFDGFVGDTGQPIGLGGPRIVLQRFRGFNPKGPWVGGGPVVALFSGTTLRDFEISMAQAGISLAGTGITVEDGRLHDLYKDSMAGDGGGYITVRRLHVSAFVGGAEHLDVVQYRAVGTEPAWDILVEDVVYERGVTFEGVKGTPAQFMFMENAGAGFANIQLRRLAAYGGSDHGVTIGRPLSGVVEDVYVQGDGDPFGDRTFAPWIKQMNAGDNFEIQRCAAVQFIGYPHTVQANRLVKNDPDPSAFHAWVRENIRPVGSAGLPPPTSAPPPPPPPAVVDAPPAADGNPPESDELTRLRVANEALTDAGLDVVHAEREGRAHAEAKIETAVERLTAALRLTSAATLKPEIKAAIAGLEA